MRLDLILLVLENLLIVAYTNYWLELINWLRGRGISVGINL